MRRQYIELEHYDSYIQNIEGDFVANLPKLVRKFGGLGTEKNLETLEKPSDALVVDQKPVVAAQDVLEQQVLL